MWKSSFLYGSQLKAVIGTRHAIALMVTFASIEGLARVDTEQFEKRLRTCKINPDINIAPERL